MFLGYGYRARSHTCLLSLANRTNCATRAAQSRKRAHPLAILQFCEKKSIRINKLIPILAELYNSEKSSFVKLYQPPTT